MNTQQAAIIKATYTRARGAAKANIRYIQHRNGLAGKKLIRELFGAEGGMERLEAYRMIDDADKGTVFFRIIISPPQIEESHTLNLAAITSQTMLHLAERIGKEVPYIAATHAADHSPYVHVHCLALVKGRLGREDFSALRETAAQVALEQQRERDRQQEQQQQREGGELALQR